LLLRLPGCPAWLDGRGGAGRRAGLGRLDGRGAAADPGRGGVVLAAGQLWPARLAGGAADRLGGVRARGYRPRHRLPIRALPLHRRATAAALQRRPAADRLRLADGGGWRMAASEQGPTTNKQRRTHVRSVGLWSLVLGQSRYAGAAARHADRDNC